MKRLLQISLVLNVALLALAGWRSRPGAPPSPTAPLPEISERESAAPALKRIGTAPKRKLWAQIETADPAQLMANLRASGCPEQTATEIVAMRICRQFHDRLLAVEAEWARSWDYAHNRSQESWDESRLRQQTLRDEMISSLESALGKSFSSLSSSLTGWPEFDDGTAAL